MTFDQIKTRCEGKNCPSKNNCLRFLDKNPETIAAALWIRREAGTSACDMYRPINVVSTFAEVGAE